ncbi:tRNA(Ile)-lysidine synthetase [Klebsormidium nitens]|uniref:tRNA(Ile)-lysidine synthetase n=1 Tax=Klebsormidium nitens TaxID=105231 RepID=A0A1Y1I199_KLENI|nr:tRNA(Ile)-lysidine synthetase [Klebsormidium nitens]|eukprot:GAQ83219.1 tRNA(Ile)-lysidine synthetase [Klebsormidium nitens]
MPRCVTGTALASGRSEALTPQWLEQQLRAAGAEKGAALAMAISGGSDSMALAVLAARLPGPPVTALVVDHALRPESAAEARQVAAWLDVLGLQQQVLTLEWPHGLPTAAKVQEAAREARYDALAGVCHARGLTALLTAHHWDDQAELLLMRLSRASGLAGLAGMAPSSQRVLAGRPLRLVRPLLGATKAQLRQVCCAAGQAWVEDPSNAMPVYLRNRVRAVLQDPHSGVSSSDVGAALALCGHLKARLEEQTQAVLEHATRTKREGRHVVDLASLAAAPPVVQAAVVQSIVHAVGPPRGGRPAKSRAVEALLTYLAKGPRRAASFSVGRTEVQAYPEKGAAGRIVFTRRRSDE